MLTTIGFDADDTLWQNEAYFRLTQDRFLQVLVDHAEPVHLRDRLEAAERRNIAYYGFGVKGFTLSMIETAVEVTDGRVPATVIADLIAFGRALLEHPMELLPHARATVAALAADFRLVLITKGDLLHQDASWPSPVWATCSTGSRSCRTRPNRPTAGLLPATAPGRIRR